MLEITTTDPASLSGTHARDWSIYGFYLGMPMSEAESLLDASQLLTFSREDAHARIVVYDRDANGRKGKQILNLCWNAPKTSLNTIVVFPDLRRHIKTELKRLLTLEALDSNSEFRKRVFGYPSRSEVTSDYPQFGIRHITYHFEDIGVGVVHAKSPDEEHVQLTLENTSAS